MALSPLIGHLNAGFELKVVSGVGGLQQKVLG
ncbi:hypothetical protein COLO4_28200 [Corchorus olitorius]|uniref:Uncharacterized protein n=1 Tax=Corchorus olitorius TaxID=93759 RepID=A0A1R3HMN4_9ROSI|nr:hypothetical protein COLO4_28200 [Corchorus olitorius]